MKNKKNKKIIIGFNLGDFGSTGNMMLNTFEYVHKKSNYDYFVIIPEGKHNLHTYTYRTKRNMVERFIDFIYGARRNDEGFKYYSYSLRIIKKIKLIVKKYEECIFHLHNIHHCDIDIRPLFKYFKNSKCKIFYTFHDGWAFTGGCYCFNYIKCNQWITGCNIRCSECSSTKKRQSSPNYVWKEKRKYFYLIKNKLTIVCVSEWMKQRVKESFLKDFNIITNLGETRMVLHNLKDDNLKTKLHLKNKKIVLSIAISWCNRKGVDYIYKIADKLPNDYVILVVGENFDKKNYVNIKHIDRLESSLVSPYYLIADCYISVSQDESLGLTTCEAQLCGVPVVAFGHGGVKETISPKSGYIVGEDNNVDRFVGRIINACEKHPFKKEDIIKNGMKFAKYEHAKRMLELYNKY